MPRAVGWARETRASRLCSHCSDDTLAASFTQARNCRGPSSLCPPLPWPSPACLGSSTLPALSGCGLDDGSPVPLSAFAPVLSPSHSWALGFCSLPSRPPPVVLTWTMGSRPEAPYYLHDIPVGLAEADSPREPLSVPRKTPWFRGSCCPASLWPPSRALDPCWSVGPPETGPALAGAPSPFLGALGRSCRKGMLTICWCSKLAPYPGRGRSVPEPSKDIGEGCAPHARSFLCPDWHVAFAEHEAAQGRGASLAGPSLGDHTAWPPPCSSSRRTKDGDQYFVALL